MCVESDRAHTAFAAALEVQFPLVSDFNRQVVRQFGIDYAEDEPFGGWWGMSRRSVFVLDTDGIVRIALPSGRRMETCRHFRSDRDCEG